MKLIMIALLSTVKDFFALTDAQMAEFVQQFINNLPGYLKAPLEACAEQLTAASAHPDWFAARQLCVLAVKYDEETPVPETAPERRPAGRRDPEKTPEKTEQLTLQFETVSKGIMERTTPVMWNNEDLDEPAFKRRNAVIDDGRRGGTKKR